MTEAEDAASSSILYENNVLVRFHDTFTTPFAPTYVEVHGTAGSLHAADVMTPEPSGRSFCTIAGDRTRSMSKTAGTRTTSRWNTSPVPRAVTADQSSTDSTRPTHWQ